MFLNESKNEWINELSVPRMAHPPLKRMIINIGVVAIGTMGT